MTSHWLAIRVVHDTKCCMITTEPLVSLLPPGDCEWLSINSKGSWARSHLQRRKKKRWRSPSLQMRMKWCVKCGKQYKILCKSTAHGTVWTICLITIQCHISTKPSKGGKRKCQWIGSLLKFHETDSTEPINRSDSVGDGDYYTITLLCLTSATKVF